MELLLALLSLAVLSLAAVAPPMRGNVIECDMCKTAVKVNDKTADHGIDVIIDVFIKECELVIPGKIGKKECKKFADDDLEKIIHELENGTDPKDVCHKLHFCKKDL